MKKLLKPYWLFLTITIPQTILFIMFSRIYYLINTELKEIGLTYWLIFGVSFGAMILLFTGYAIFKQIKKLTLTKVDAIVILVVYIAYIYFLIYKYEYIIPFSIPNWMFLDMDPMLLISGLFMPVLMYCITACVVLYTPTEGYRLLRDIIILVAIPLFYYVLVYTNVIFGIDSLFSSDLFEQIFIVLIVASTVVFMFLAMRIIYYLFNKKKRSWRVVSIVVGLVLPLAGLILNQTIFFSLMGDFSSVYFYIIVVLNGIILILPEQKSIIGKLIVFFIKSIFYAFTLYFFIVFLPFIPLALIMTIAFGLGFLLMSPTLLMIVHTRSLIEDYKCIKSQFQNKKIVYKIILIFIAGIMIIPSCMTLSFLRDKNTINKSLEYIYEEGYDDTSSIKISERSLKRTLENIGKNDNENRWLMFGSTSYISSFYNSIVLDNATISDGKMKIIREVFIGTEQDSDENERNTTLSARTNSPNVNIKNYQVETVFDSEHGYYRSWLHLDIENTGNGRNQYITNFTLPNGCYISDYYLYVGDEKKMGLITDKRAANWIYQQIVRVRRDPGILTYLTDSEVSFRVFPFSRDEVRKTGIEFVHIEPIKLSIDNIDITLSTSTTIDSVIKISDNISYVPTGAKELLPQVKRTLKYNFIIDCSKNAEDKLEAYLEIVNSYIKANNIDKSDVTLFMVNYNIQSYTGDIDQNEYINKIDHKGGFFADRAIKMILYDNYINTKDTFPAIIVVTDDFDSAVIMDDYDNLKVTFPDSDYIYYTDADTRMYSYSLLTKEKKKVAFDDIEQSQKNVLAYPSIVNVLSYLSIDDEGSVVLSDNFNNDLLIELGTDKWTNGVTLDAMNTNLNLRTGDRNSKSLAIVRGSITARVMTPLTSFIVLEIQAQEKVLLEKQKQLLSSDKQYLSDSQDELMDMSEPPFWILMILLIIFIAYRYNKEKSVQSKIQQR